MLNDYLINHTRKFHQFVNMLFLLITLLLTLLLIVYWQTVLEPRIHSEFEANAQIIATSQGIFISQNLISEQGDLRINQISNTLGEILLLKDPIIEQVFFKKISVELDEDFLLEQASILQISPNSIKPLLTVGTNLCALCFQSKIPIYAHRSNELLIGVATLQVNHALFDNFKSDVENKLLIEAFIVLLVLFFTWFCVMQLIRQLQLQITIRQKTEHALEAAKLKAEYANESKSQFLAKMSHEIRTPINGVIGLSFLMLKEKLSDKQQQYIKKIETSANILLSLINDILDFSKIESGKMELEKISFTLDEVLDSVNTILNPLAEEKSVDLVFSIADQVPHFLIGDPLRLKQVLLNLCNNALKFTEQGGIMVSVQLIKLQDKQLSLQFDVTDTGIGIEPLQQDKLFKSFTQVDNSTSRKYGGTGLGLAICKQLTELMHGEIWLKSKVGVGSCFSFTASFTVNEKSENFNEKALHTSNLATDFSWPNATILLVEDNRINQEITLALLEDSKMSIDIANNGIEAIEKISAHPYDLVIMDIQMPKMDGITATAIIRKKFSSQQLPIIAMTAHAMTADIENFLSSGMNDYISKPFQLADFFRVISKWLAVVSPAKQQNIVLKTNKPTISLPENFKGIEINELLSRLRNDRHLVLQLLTDFIDKQQPLLTQVTENIKNGDLTVAKEIIHGMKGTSGNLCLQDIYPLCISLEQAFFDGETQISLDLLQQLSQAFSQLRDFVEKFKSILECDANATTIKTPQTCINDNGLQHLVANLEQLIIKKDLQATIVVKELTSILTHTDYEYDITQLILHLNLLNYENALISIQNIAQLLSAQHKIKATD